jgi:hypothetical protein
MKDSHLTVRDKFKSGLGVRAVLLAATVVVGLLFVLNTFYAGAGAQKVSAAQANFQGGATPEMLAYALNFKDGTDFAVFGGNSVRNHGNSTFRGNVGSTGVMDGVAKSGDLRGGVSYGQAKQDIGDAMRVINQLPCLQVDDSDLTGKTFGPGVYCLSSASLAGAMTLNGGDDPNSIFVFRVAGDIRSGDNSSIVLTGGAKATNSYFVSNGDINIGASNDVESNLISANGINVGSSSTIGGKTIGVGGDVSVDSVTAGAGTGDIEICKNLAPNDPIPVGTIFNFTVAGVANPVQVMAGACSAPISVAVGNVTVTEAARANTAVTNITAVSGNPPNTTNRLVSSSFPLRQAVVTVVEGDVNNEAVVTFTNQTTRTGFVEICKFGLDRDVNGIFQFTVLGAPGPNPGAGQPPLQTIAVPVGFCSGPITVTVFNQGSATSFTTFVTELAQPTFRAESASTLPVNRFISFTPDVGVDQFGNTFTNTNGGVAAVTVPVGDPSTMTTVNFNNRSLPGRIKVCKITAQPDVNNIPVGTSFRFAVTGTPPPGAAGATAALTVFVDVPAGTSDNPGCVFVSPQLWVVDTPITVTEIGLSPGATLPPGLTFADVRVSSITTSSPPPGISTDLVGKTITFQVVNEDAVTTFTDFIFRPAILKLCKVAGNGVTAGKVFSFNLTPANPATTFAFNINVSVPAGSCTFLNGPFPAVAAFPGIGTFNGQTGVVATEAAATGFNVTAITSPSGGPITNLSLPNRTGTITLNALVNPNGSLNELSFTNAAAVVNQPYRAKFDFDGDGKSDPVIFRPSTGQWWVDASSGGGFRATAWGTSTDKLVAADYDGDGIADYAVYRGGTWYILNSGGGTQIVQFGLPTDIPQPGDYDGDGKADLVVYRPSEGTWYMQLSSQGFRAFQFGVSTDTPVAADYDGDGQMDAAVYRGGTWYILGSTSGFTAFQFGLSTDRPVPADYDGDHKADAAVFRDGTWFILGSSAGFYGFPYGTAGDIPVPADYDGDGKTDASVYRPSTNTWYVLKTSQNASGGGSTAFQFGAAGDVLLNY